MAVDLIFPEELTDELRFVMGRPNFWCGPLAHVFQAAGYDIPKKAEAEQAFIIHWLVKLVLQHGSEWRTVARIELDAADLKAKELQAAKEAAAASKPAE